MQWILRRVEVGPCIPPAAAFAAFHSRILASGPRPRVQWHRRRPFILIPRTPTRLYRPPPSVGSLMLSRPIIPCRHPRCGSNLICRRLTGPCRATSRGRTRSQCVSLRQHLVRSAVVGRQRGMTQHQPSQHLGGDALRSAADAARLRRQIHVLHTR